jgi:hemerythrin
VNLATGRHETSVGVRLLDLDHRELAIVIGELRAAVFKNQDRSLTGPLLHKLTDFSQTHFGLEEGMMSATRYPRLKEHCANHQQMMEQLGALVERCEQSDAALNGQALNFLTEWHTLHLENHDLSFGHWLSDCGLL